MMKKIYLLGLAISSILWSCQKKEAIDPTIQCEIVDHTMHSKSEVFQKILNDYKDKGIPGIAFLVKDQEGVWAGSSGYADIQAGIKMMPCHINKVASLTKIFMGVLAFKLSEEGVLNLNAKVSDYLSASDLNKIANAEEIRVIDLLRHSTGIFDVITDNSFYLSVLNDPPAFRNQRDILKYVRGKSALFSAGSQSEYSNTNTLLLSMVIDEISDEGHAQLLRNYILNPLGLKDSYYYYHEPLPSGKVAQGYYDLFNNETIVNVSSYNTGSGNGYTGLYTNVLDLLTFSDALFEQKTLLTPNSLSQMLTFNLPHRGEIGRLLGLGSMKDFIDRAPDEYAYGHRGRDLGYSADMFYFPEKNQHFILIVNYGTDGASALRPTFFELREVLVDAMMQ